jgi:hypothetical protein
MYLLGMATGLAYFLSQIPSGLHVALWVIFLGYCVFRYRMKILADIKGFVPIAAIAAILLVPILFIFTVGLMVSAFDLTTVPALILFGMALFFTKKALDWLLP